MPNMKVVNMAGKEVGTIELSEKVFGAKVNEAVLHTAVRAFLMNQRQGFLPPPETSERVRVDCVPCLWFIR